jgi:5-methylcytosine-specific restriction protein A
MPNKPATFGRTAPAQRRGGSTTLRDHSRTYRALCALLLGQEPLCRYCRAEGLITPATVIDHIVALSLGGSNDPLNLTPACKGCNDAKAGDERAFTAKGYELEDIAFDPTMAAWLAAGGIQRN